MTGFDPNQPGVPGKLFGLPYSLNNADIVLIPVPWDVTASYAAGTAFGPEGILKASPQIDYNSPGVKKPWELGIHMLPISKEWSTASRALRKESEAYIEWVENGRRGNSETYETIRRKINTTSSELNNWVRSEAHTLLGSGKLVGTVGGDHSTAYGLIEALAQEYPSFGILQVDAHMDLRESYEGFEHSHASIMRNALQLPSIVKLVQLGIRDYCQEEWEYCLRSKGRIKTFFDQEVKKSLFEGTTWQSMVQEIIAYLPKEVYISFDIDGLDPKLCPNTGTPVPGGLEFPQVDYLLRNLVHSGRKIIGFDLSEVSPGNEDWDSNVGARVLYMLSIMTGLSNGKLDWEG